MKKEFNVGDKVCMFPNEMSAAGKKVGVGVVIDTKSYRADYPYEVRGTGFVWSSEELNLCLGNCDTCKARFVCWTS